MLVERQPILKASQNIYKNISDLKNEIAGPKKS